MQKIREAIARQDAAVLEPAAHTFRGSASNFCAPAAVGELETMGHEGVQEGALVACEALEAALQQMKPALARLTEGRPCRVRRDVAYGGFPHDEFTYKGEEIKDHGL
jgi:HPt (histidine-containing phosphotransfer) domain-containing protein